MRSQDRNEANAKALRDAYAAIRPGTTFDEVSKIVGDVMRQEGYNGFGAPHNVGIDHTDQPNSLARPGRRPAPLRFEIGSGSLSISPISRWAMARPTSRT
jgi:Xaa-Pro aminopeptidase